MATTFAAAPAVADDGFERFLKRIFLNHHDSGSNSNSDPNSNSSGSEDGDDD